MMNSWQRHYLRPVAKNCNPARNRQPVRNKKAARFKKNLFKYSRALHVYFSSALCLLLIFFSVTGVTLNHQWTLQNKDGQNIEHYSLKDELLDKWIIGTGSEWVADITSLQAYLSANHGLPHAKSVDVDHEFYEISFEYRVPAGYASAILNVETGQLSIESESGSALAILNDLHKGRHSGKLWFWLIDISAIAVVIFSSTGLIILYQGHKYRSVGSLSIALGLLVPGLIYFFFVPSL